MPNQRAADHLTRKLTEGLIHPGDGKSGPVMLPLPMFRSATGIPRDQAEHFAKEAGLPSPDISRLTAEALINEIENDGQAIVDQAELEQLRTAAGPREEWTDIRQLAFTCRTCGNPLFKAAVDPNNPTLDGPQLATLNATCPHGTDQ